MKRPPIMHLLGLLTVIVLVSLVLTRHGEATPQAVPSVDSRGLELSMPPVPPGWEYVRAAGLNRFPGIDKAGVMGFIEQYFPLELNTLKGESMRRPNSAVEALTDLVQKALGMIRIKEDDPDRFVKLVKFDRLERKAREEAAALKLGQASDASQLKERDRLRATLNETFKVKQELMGLEIAAIEEDLEELRNLVALRNQHSETIVKQRMSELAGDSNHLEW